MDRGFLDRSAGALASGKPAILHCIVDPQTLTPSQKLDTIHKQGEETYRTKTA
jgi:hypothetical protein